MILTLAEVEAAVEGELGGGFDLGITFSGVSTDSRKPALGKLFVPLAGKNFDGHNYMEAAADNGAAGFLASKKIVGSKAVKNFPTVFVDDTMEALGRLALFVRRKLGLKVIAVTGSAGKTTTKEMAAKLINDSGIKVLKTPGNFNNLIGLPLTLLGAVGDEKAAVLELGISEPGEMEKLSAICEPDAAVVTSVAACHTEGLGDVEGVAREKLKIASAMRRGGTLILPRSDSWLSNCAASVDADRLWFGWEEDADVRGYNYENLGAGGSRFSVDGTEVQVGLPGRHNATNALAAIAAVKTLGIDLTKAGKALASMTASPLRGELRRTKSGVNIIVDCYNANPKAVCAALELLADLAKGAKKIAALGEMLELGDLSKSGHETIGEKAASLGVDELHLVGESCVWTKKAAIEKGMSEKQILLHNNVESLADALVSRASAVDWVLIKGSRALGMEKAAALLEAKTDLQ